MICTVTFTAALLASITARIVNRGMSGIGIWMCLIFSTRGTAFWRQSEMMVAIHPGLERASGTASLRLPRKGRNQLDLVYLNVIET